MILIVALFLVPFVSNRGERAPSRRPVAVLSVIVIYTVLGVLTYEGNTAPWSPQMTALERRPDSRIVRQTQHAPGVAGGGRLSEQELPQLPRIDGIGGRRGPDLTTVGSRLTRDQLIDQVSNGTPGARCAGRRRDAGLRQADRCLPQMTALAAFLASLRPPGQPPAVPAAQNRSAATRTRHESRRSMRSCDRGRRNPLLTVTLAMTRGRSMRGAGSSLRRRDAGPLARRTPGRISRRPCAICSCAGVADRAVRVAAVVAPHGAALAAHDGGAAAGLAGGAALPAAPRRAGDDSTHWIGPLLRARAAAAIFRRLDASFVALPLFVAATWIWHARPPTNGALRSDAWHYLEHVPVFSGGAVCSGTRWSGPIRAGRAGRSGCWCRT